MSWRSFVSGVTLCAVTLLSGASELPAKDGYATTLLRASDVSAGARFGTAVAIYGDLAIVSAPYDDSAVTAGGAVYVFENIGGTWVEMTKLFPDDPAEDKRFGSSLALSGNTAIIGARHDATVNTDSGAAYVFEYDGRSWHQAEKLIGSGVTLYSYFGCDVDVDGDVAVVGAHGLQEYMGKIYVFEKDGDDWSETASLTGSDTAPGDHLGYAVGVSGTVVVGGAISDDDAGDGSGSAYVFEKSGTSWTQTCKLVADDAAESDHFGTALAVDDTTVLVGADGNDEGAYRAGAAYVFSRQSGSWTQTEQLTAADNETSGGFGVSLAMDGDVALIGKQDYHDAAYRFERSLREWTQTDEFIEKPYGIPCSFGQSLDVSGEVLIIGADAYHNADLAGPGDANRDSCVDGTDLAIWQQHYDPLGLDNSTYEMGDFSGDGKVDGTDLALWQQNYDPLGLSYSGAAFIYTPIQTEGLDDVQPVPEPATLLLVGAGIVLGLFRPRTRRRRRSCS